VYSLFCVEIDCYRNGGACESVISGMTSRSAGEMVLCSPHSLSGPRSAQQESESRRRCIFSDREVAVRLNYIHRYIAFFLSVSWLIDSRLFCVCVCEFIRDAVIKVSCVRDSSPPLPLRPNYYVIFNCAPVQCQPRRNLNCVGVKCISLFICFVARCRWIIVFWLEFIKLLLVWNIILENVN